MRLAVVILFGIICLPAIGVGQMTMIPGDTMIPCDRPPRPSEEGRILAVLNQAPAGIPRIEALLEAGYYYLLLPGEENEDLSRAMYYAQQARELSKAQGYDDGYAEGLLLTGQVFNEGAKTYLAKIALDSAESLARNNMKRAHREGATRREARALRQIAFAYESPGNWDEAEKLLVQLVQLYKTMGYPYLHYTYERLAVMEILVNNYDRALFYILEALKSMERTGDDSQAADFYYDLGYIYLQLGQTQKGMDYLKKAFTLYERKPEPALFDLTDDMAESLAKTGKPADGLEVIGHTLQKYTPQTRYEKRVIEDAYATCYRVLKQFDLADLHMKRSAALAVEDHRLNMYKIEAMGQLYVEWGKFDSARPYLEKCVRMDFFPKRDLSQLHFLLYQVDSADGHYISAMDHLKKAKALNDTLYQEANQRIAKELEVRYETEKKDSELRQAKFTGNLTIAGIGLLFVFLALLFRQYKMEVKSKRAINEKNNSLQRLVDEKEWLLKEVHHRVKNNLHIVTSLLETQSALAGGDARKAIQDSQHRIYAMSLIHQKLYQGAEAATIDFGMYLRELVLYLRESFDTDTHINFRIDADEIEIDVAQAAHLGLILNEAITNAIKYAFTGRPQGVISISVQRQPDDYLLLVVKDDGKGLPVDFDVERSNSLGIRLMKGLSEDYDGELRITSGEGTTVTLLCRLESLLHYSENQSN